MRIISGKYKGRRIPVRKNFPSRPTTDFAKESLFNILSNRYDFDGLRVLDLFAGTGSIGFEFASRGAIVTCVELDHRSFRFIKDTAGMLGFSTLRAVKADVFRFIEKETASYNIIFADPPYQLPDLEKIPDLILSGQLCEPEGRLILEHSDRQRFSGHPQLADTRSYGSVNFSFFMK